MRKLRAKQLQRLARIIYKAETPEFTPRRIYRRLKKLYTRGLIG